MTHDGIRNVGRQLAPSIRRLAQWWAQASNEARFHLLGLAIKGEKEAPSVEAIHLAAYLAESEQGTVETREG